MAVSMFPRLLVLLLVVLLLLLRLLLLLLLRWLWLRLLLRLLLLLCSTRRARCLRSRVGAVARLLLFQRTTHFRAHCRLEAEP